MLIPKSLIQELRTIGELRHQCLVPYVATMEDEGGVGFIMPLITGQSLRAYLQNISLSFEWKLTLVCDHRQIVYMRD